MIVKRGGGYYMGAEIDMAAWNLEKPMAKAWFSYIVIHRRCPCGLIVGGQRQIKSFVFLKSFSPSAIQDNRSPMNCDI